MPRVSDVDSIAPDDLSAVAPVQADPVTVSVTKSLSKKIKKSLPFSAPITPSAPLDASPPDSAVDVDSVYKILGHAKSPLSSLLIHPHVFDFSERDDDETILVVARQHWITNLRWVLTTIVMLAIPSLFYYLPTIIEFPARYQFITYLFWYLITFAYVFENFLSWYFNVYIITNKRIIDIDFNNLLTKKYSEAGIEQVQDVTSSVIGAIPTLFNYGNILIQTASEISELEFSRTPNPEKIIKVMQELRDHHPGGKI